MALQLSQVDLGKFLKKRIVDEAVREASLFLDREQPGWAHRVDLASFDIRNACKCIVHHVAGWNRDTYDAWPVHLLATMLVSPGWQGMNARLDNYLERQFFWHNGFDLQKAWHAAISARQSPEYGIAGGD